VTLPDGDYADAVRAEEILNHVRAQPFHPFRVFVSDGAHYDVHHPDFILVSRTNVNIAFPPRRGRVPERTVFVDPVHVTRIEPLNGHKRRSKRTG
jgi:hypothetical protein